jgi:hypothetical protein
MIAAVMALIDTCGRRHRRFEELFDPLKCGNGASAAWGTPTIDRLLLLRGEPWMNDEKRLNSAFPGYPGTQRALGKPESPLLIPIRNTGYARQCTRTMHRPR